MQKFIMAIPSYRRAEKQGTLEYLSGMGIPKERLYIFVQEKADQAAYEKYAARCQIIYAPADGVAQARNNILRYFKGQEDILMLDDDVSYIGRLRGSEIRPIKNGEEFEETIEKCFAQAARKARTSSFNSRGHLHVSTTQAAIRRGR